MLCVVPACQEDAFSLSSLECNIIASLYCAAWYPCSSYPQFFSPLKLNYEELTHEKYHIQDLTRPRVYISQRISAV